MIWEADGNMSLETGENQGIYKMFPGINGSFIRSLKTEQEENGVRIFSAGIDLSLTAETREEGCFCIKPEIIEQKEQIHTLSLFYEAELKHVEGIYQTAHGMGDPAGYLPEEEMRKKEEILAYGIFSVKFGSGVVTFYGTRHEHYRNVYRVRRKGEKYYLSCELEIENTEIKQEKLPEIKILTKGTMEEQLTAAAEEIGEQMSARKSKEAAYHWCSWYYCYHNFNMPQLEEYLEGFETWKYAHDMKYFQIDAGYCTSLGDWLYPNEQWRPHGLKAAFEKIREYGYLPGIWIGPFMVGNRSRLFAEHPDWVLYDLGNQPVKAWIMDNEPKVWGYQDEEYYVLDISHPAAMDYMRNVFRTMKEWGAEFFKTDFMLWGIQDSTKVKRYTPGKTSVEYFREFLQVIREEIGEDSYWLGCIAPFLPFVGYADGMRIGGDVGSSWHGEFGPENMIQSLKGNLFSNNSLYQIDPDAVMLRDFHIRLNDREIESLALLAAMSGGCIYTSDPLFKAGEDRRKLFHFIKPDKKRKGEMPFLEEQRKEIVLIQREEETGNALVYLFNPTESEITAGYDLEKLGLDREMYFYSYHEQEMPELTENKWYVTIPAHGNQLYKVMKKESKGWKKDNLWINLKE